jgi:hypothetical protein
MPGKRRPDLIVPIRDRRQRRRYLTLRNFGYSLIAAIVLFLGITIHSEMRGVGPASYGRLLERELPQVEQKPVEVVRESPTVANEATHADPTLIEPMTREQWLRADTTAAPVTVDASQRAVAAVATGQTEVAIVGGPDGVQIVQRERRKPVLAGGFGRR